MGLTETEAEQHHKAHLSDPCILIIVLPILRRPGVLPGVDMGPERGLGTTAAGSANSGLLSMSNSKMNFPNEESKSKLQTARILESGLC